MKYVHFIVDYPFHKFMELILLKQYLGIFIFSSRQFSFVLLWLGHPHSTKLVRLVLIRGSQFWFCACLNFLWVGFTLLYTGLLSFGELHNSVFGSETALNCFFFTSFSWYKWRWVSNVIHWKESKYFTAVCVEHPIFCVPYSGVRFDMAGFSLKYCLQTWLTIKSSDITVKVASTVELNFSIFCCVLSESVIFC